MYTLPNYKHYSKNLKDLNKWKDICSHGLEDNISKTQLFF